MSNTKIKITPILMLFSYIISQEKYKEQFVQQLNKESISDLFELATKDEIGSHLVDKLKKWEIEYDSEWNNMYNDVEKRITNLMNELERVAAYLSKKNIQIVGLKNAGITKGLYSNYACSPMGDIDLLVRSRDFHAAHQILMNELGYTFKFRSELEEEDLEEAFKGGGTEYYKDVNGYKVWLELQWRPVAGRWIQPHNEPNGDELMDRSIAIPNSAVRMLCPEDNLLQVCLHTAKHSYCRAPGFRLHTDVDRIVHFSDIPWDSFMDKVKNTKLKTAVYYSLVIPSELLKTPIPVNVLNALKPNIARRFIIEKLLNKAGLTDQNKKKFSKVGYIIFNLALYDSLGEMSTAIFPDSQIMKKRYEFDSNFLLPYFHLKRLVSLVLKRAKL